MQLILSSEIVQWH